jgi:hypothetical protein
VSSAFASLLNSALLSCYQKLDTAYPDTHGWRALEVLSQAPLTADALLNAIGQDIYVGQRQGVNKYLDTITLNLWNARLSPMACTQNLLAVRLLLNLAVMSKNKIDTILSRGEEVCALYALCALCHHHYQKTN